MIIGKLQLHNHTMLAAEKIFASDKVEFPHLHKAVVIELCDSLALRQEARAPAAQCLGIVAPYDFHVEDLQPLGLGG